VEQIAHAGFRAGEEQKFWGKKFVLEEDLGELGEAIHELRVCQIKRLRYLQWMKFIVKTSDSVHASPNARFIWGYSRAKNDTNNLSKELGVVGPFTGPELSVTADNLRFDMLHATEIDETNGSVIIEKVIPRMRVGMESLHSEELKEK